MYILLIGSTLPTTTPLNPTNTTSVRIKKMSGSENENDWITISSSEDYSWSFHFRRFKLPSLQRLFKHRPQPRPQSSSPQFQTDLPPPYSQYDPPSYSQCHPQTNAATPDSSFPLLSSLQSFFAFRRIKATDVPQWTWSNAECKRWLYQLCTTHFQHVDCES